MTDNERRLEEIRARAQAQSDIQFLLDVIDRLRAGQKSITSKAHWILRPEWKHDEEHIQDATCSECGYRHGTVALRNLPTWCPRCKRIMINIYQE